jgi:hypothetical protein
METIKYKVVELTTVTAEDLELLINEWVRKGWNLETIHFAMRDSSKRPAMAFVLFTKSEKAKNLK